MKDKELRKLIGSRAKQRRLELINLIYCRSPNRQQKWA